LAPKPPLGLSAVVRDLNGAETIWWSGDPKPYNRPQGVSFSTRRGEGFSEASVTLARDIRGEYFDLPLLGEVILVGDSGEIAYEGRLQSTPRSVDQNGHSITVGTVGYMTSAQDRTFKEIYIDRDLSKWQPMSVQRKINVLSSFGTSEASVLPDATTGQPALHTSFQGPWVAAPGLPICEAWYDAGPGVKLGFLHYAAKKGPNTGRAATGKRTPTS
jgi:hypothetical protein